MVTKLVSLEEYRSRHAQLTHNERILYNLLFLYKEEVKYLNNNGKRWLGKVIEAKYNSKMKIVTMRVEPLFSYECFEVNFDVGFLTTELLENKLGGYYEKNGGIYLPLSSLIKIKDWNIFGA